ncbi:LOW QUALITY PROTEIN: hypothetical protein Smp_036720 [Schistosoma mansoni]|uniref:hypothetical protein n=1 Tax=Schistosoma mansoni TaxID=6183 RepID=UPI00022DBF3B|nr:LOW QUALITY PROTEIN: hypothetical protein Smp_036720 [Schistosoma mansoni]|eukprot:XP_018653157.1 LOW QUALITY PROTEIN: hypothetical protein Smp_036720 [Schistosoma mansoni]
MYFRHDTVTRDSDYVSKGGDLKMIDITTTTLLHLDANIPPKPHQQESPLFEFPLKSIFSRNGFHHCVLTNTKDLRKAVELMQNRRTEDNCVRLHVRAIPKLLRPECRSQINDDTQFSGQYLPSYLEAIGLQPSIQNDSTDNEKQFFNQDLFPKHEYRNRSEILDAAEAIEEGCFLDVLFKV